MVAHETHGVAVIHHHQGVEFLCQIADALQIGNVAVHGEDAVGGDQDLLGTGFSCCHQLRPQVLHIVVLIAVTHGLAQAHAVDDGGMVQFVGDHRILLAQQGFKQTAVGIEAGGIEDGIVHAQEIGNLLLQLLVNGLGTADKADGGQTEAPVVIAFLCSLDQLRMGGKAQIVVGTEVDHTGLCGGVDAGILGGRDNALFPPGTGLTDGIQLRRNSSQCRFHISPPFWLSSPERPYRTCRNSWHQSPSGNRYSGNGG